MEDHALDEYLVKIIETENVTHNVKRGKAGKLCFHTGPGNRYRY